MLHREVLEDAFLRLVEAVVVLVEDLRETVAEVEVLVGRTRVPGQRRAPSRCSCARRSLPPLIGDIILSLLSSFARQRSRAVLGHGLAMTSCSS